MASGRAWRPSADGASSSSAGQRAASVCPPEQPSPRIERLRRRAAFVSAAKGLRIVKPGFVLQVRCRDDDGRIGIGFTASKRVGNAVVRNRVRRRLKEVARLHLQAHGLAGCDHVLIARREGLCRPFALLVRDFGDACAQARSRLARSDGSPPGR